jgi:heme exporter protein C
VTNVSADATGKGKAAVKRLTFAVLVVVLLSVAAYAAFFVAPTERTMGLIQRIFYLHMPSAITAFLAFFIAFVANLLYVFRRERRWDWLGVSAAEVGTAFVSVVLVTGPIWAKPVWGIWWTWDARLTSTFVLWLLYISYLLLRTLIEDPERRALASAVFGIFAFLDVPLVYMSIRWWRTQHPQPVLFGGPGSGLQPTMKLVLLLSFVSLVSLMILLMRERYRLEALRAEVDTLRREAEAQ